MIANQRKLSRLFRAPSGGFAACILLVTFTLCSPIKANGMSFLVMDMQSGTVLREQNADVQSHPGGIAQIMTLYVIWSMVANGELVLETRTNVSARATFEPAIGVGLEAGDSIELRRLVEFIAAYQATDAATALAEAVAGSARNFGNRMNAIADLMCLSNTNFVVDYDISIPSQFTTVRDAAIIARFLLNHFPEKLPLFALPTVEYKGRAYRNMIDTLGSDIDGLTSTYLRSLNLGYGGVFTAERNGVRLIVVIFDAQNANVRQHLLAELLEDGFASIDSLKRGVPPQLEGCPTS